MANSIIGFIGVDAYDIILYLARICCNHNEKVLLVDNSLSKSLLLCIPNLVEIDTNVDYIEYHGIDFTTMATETIKNCEYDKVFIYYGLHNIYSDFSICNNYIIVSDIQLHTLLAIKKIELDYKKVMHIVMKDVYDVMIPEDKIIKVLHLTGTVKIYTHFLDAWDIKYRIACQEQNLTSFHKISNSLKEYLYETSKVIYPEKSMKELKNVIKKTLKDN